MKKIQTVVSLMLVFCVMISMVPVHVFAEETTGSVNSEDNSTVTVPVDSTVPAEETISVETTAAAYEALYTEETVEEDSNLEHTMDSDAIIVTKDAALSGTATSGVCGPNGSDNVIWEYDSDTATITISGTGKMDSYLDARGDWTESEDVPPWNHLFSQIEHFVIEPGVTNVGGYAFQYCSKLISITIPASVTKIEQYILGTTELTGGPQQHPNIKEIHYGGTQEAWETLLATADSYSNSKLFNESIVVYFESDGYKPLTWTVENGVLTVSGVGQIPNYQKNEAPWARMYIRKIVLADTLTSIGDYAFYGCTSLEEVIIPNSITRIGKCAFQECGNMLKNVTIPDSVTIIDDYAFYKTGLTGISIPASVTTIGSYAFANCKYLVNVSLSRGLKELKSCAFFQCGGLKEIMIPDTVTVIGDQAFYYCQNLRSVTIPEGVATIGKSAFRDCTSLTEIVIPDSVTTIGDFTFDGCTNLTEAAIGSGLTTVGHSIFNECKKLQKVSLKSGPKSIAGSMFAYCPKLTTVTIPETVTEIGSSAFYKCTGLVSVSIPESVQTVGSNAFNGCTALKTVFYGGSMEQWSAVNVKNGNTPLEQAVIYCGDGILSITGMTIDRQYRNFYMFLSDPHIYQMNGPLTGIYAELSQLMTFDSAAVAEGIVWTSSDESVLKVVSGGMKPQFKAVALGSAVVSATNSLGETVAFPVTVLQPNALEFTSIHGTKQFYAEGGFYSEETDFSDCVEVYLRLENKRLTGCPFTPADPADSSLVTSPIHVSAVVSGTDLSFARDSYQNTYTAVYDPIAYETSLADLLMLFPRDPDNLVTGSSYTVQITMTSESFPKPVVQTCSFTISDATQAKISGHIDFASGDTGYIVSKHNHYGQNMAELKKDPEYFFSKLYSLDFENYYEVVIADILMGALDYQLDNGFSIMPKVLKEWKGYYKTISSSIDTLLKKEFDFKYTFDETKIDKIFKLNKYDTATRNSEIDDAGYQLVMDYFANPNNTSKIHEVFQKVDRTKQIFGLISVATDFRKEMKAWGNTICLMNAFHLADEELKQVMVTVSGMIPADADPDLLEAIQDYLNYDHDITGQAAEIWETFVKSAHNVTFDTLESVWGTSAGKFIGGKLLGFIGNIGIKGTTKTLATTAAFQGVTKAFGVISTGVSIGVSLSDILCDTSGKATEMGKIIAMSEYAPYFIEALEIYENRMTDWQTEASVDLFETAFRLHKAVQLYIMDHTYDLLLLKGESLIQIIRGNAEYFEVAADVLAHQRGVKWMNCCDAVDMSSHTVTQTRIIAICCPIDAYVYDEAGNEVVRILRDQLEYAADGISVYIRDREKFVAVPAGQEYSVKIVATDAGTMDYLVMEYDENMERQQTVKQEDVPLVTDRVFTGTVPKKTDGSQENYHLTIQNLCENGHQFVEGICTVCGSYLPGDVDRDGKIRDTDAIYLIWYTLFPTEYPLNKSIADYNNDGEVTSADAVKLLWYALELEQKSKKK